jgi:hypothetical protein
MPNDDKGVNFTFPIQSLGIQMVDERNKRGRPPKKRKPELELREKEILNQRIMAQVKQGFKEQALAEGLDLNITTSMADQSQFKAPEEKK